VRESTNSLSALFRSSLLLRKLRIFIKSSVRVLINILAILSDLYAAQISNFRRTINCSIVHRTIFCTYLVNFDVFLCVIRLSLPCHLVMAEIRLQFLLIEISVQKIR
jgi:hypothetical protein